MFTYGMRSGLFAWLMLVAIFIGTPLFGSAAEAAACHTRVDTIPQTIPTANRHCHTSGERSCPHHKGKQPHPMKTQSTDSCKTGAFICYISQFPGAASSEELNVSGPENQHLLLPRVASAATNGKEKTDTPYERRTSTVPERPDPRPPSV